MCLCGHRQLWPLVGWGLFSVRAVRGIVGGVGRRGALTAARCGAVAFRLCYPIIIIQPDVLVV